MHEKPGVAKDLDDLLQMSRLLDQSQLLQIIRHESLV